MEKKTKHRILGVLVVTGLVVIFLPFFQGNQELPASSRVSLMKAPPFPDQSAQANLNDTLQTSVTQAPTMTSGIIKQQPDDTIAIKSSSTRDIAALNNTVIPIATGDKTVTAVPQPQNNNMDRMHTVAMTKKKNQALQLSRVANTHVDNNELLNLRDAVWIIQIGSFKNKIPALRLVNQLRDKGYPAFIQQLGNDIRVFVGPENKQIAARELADHLESHLHVHGIVISYKPLTL